MKEDIIKSFNESSNLIRESSSLADEIERVIISIIDCIKNGNKIILFGNGGSAADAQHIAAEFIGRYKIERNGIPAISLTTDSSIVTALANDYSFDVIFSRQCESLVSNNDIVIGISTSGNSKNIQHALETAKNKGAKTVALLGNYGGTIKDVADFSIIVNSSNTPRVQEVHRVIYHTICEIVEQKCSNL